LAGQFDAVLQPQVPPLPDVSAMHLLPIVLVTPQLMQLFPVSPQAASAVPAAQVPALQQPPLHWKPPAQLVEHSFVVVLQALPVEQSPGTVQPHLPATQTWLSAPVEQLRQAPPIAPQALAAVPATQLVPSQQPPLQARPPTQLDWQVCVVVLHACIDGQSVAALQPQLPPARQAWPSGLALQSLQLLPVAPHLVCVVPPTQLVPSQQPPLQVSPPRQLTAQVLVPGLQACPAGQSADETQPQPPETQAWPDGSLVQSTHRPEVPQLVLVLPAWQVLPLPQQLPEQGMVPLQAVVQACATVSQELPPPQSPEPLQPQAPPPGAGRQM
jgi:hypothetical protein